jgi:hypothetical protein
MAIIIDEKLPDWKRLQSDIESEIQISGFIDRYRFTEGRYLAGWPASRANPRRVKEFMFRMSSVEQRNGAMIVLDVARKHEQAKHQAGGVGDDMTLAPFHPLGGIKAARAATFRGFHALAVDDAG